MSICRLWRDAGGSDIIGDDADIGDIGDIADAGGAEKLLSDAEEDGPFSLGTDRSEKSPALCSSKPCA